MRPRTATISGSGSAPCGPAHSKPRLSTCARARARPPPRAKTPARARPGRGGAGRWRQNEGRIGGGGCLCTLASISSASLSSLKGTHPEVIRAI